MKRIFSNRWRRGLARLEPEPLNLLTVDEDELLADLAPGVVGWRED
jgi:hypothetical protein